MLCLISTADYAARYTAAKHFFCVFGGAVAQSVERVTPGEEVLGSIPAVAARFLLVGSVSV